jgi:hypothetical protein
MKFLPTVLLILFFLFIQRGFTQSISLDQQDSLLISPAQITRYAEKVSGKAADLQGKLDKKSSKAIAAFRKQEEKLKRKLVRLDSAKAKQLFANADQQYQRLEQRLQQTGSLQHYIPSLDTMETSLAFLRQAGSLLPGMQGQQKVQDALNRVKGLEGQFQKAEEIKNFLKERRQFLKLQLQKLGFSRQLKKLNKEVYYYNQQVAEYKDILRDPKKTEQKVLALLRNTKLFRDFIKRNGMLARLFPIPDAGSGSQGQQTGFAALQSRTQVTSFIQQSVLRSSTSMPQLEQNIQGAQSQLSELRNRISQLGGNGNETEIPDFKPNNQKTKSFWKRVELGTNIQSQKSNGILPVTTDLGLSVGYKLNDRSIIGIGGSYKLGWGSGGWKNIRLSNQGVGLRSFVDWRIKKTFWLSGGYEWNYRPALQDFAASSNGNWDGIAWQRSGLIGLSKIVSTKTKFLKKAKLQLLWDFLSYEQRPRTQAILFRIGYSF